IDHLQPIGRANLLRPLLPPEWRYYFVAQFAGISRNWCLRHASDGANDLLAIDSSNPTRDEVRRVAKISGDTAALIDKIWTNAILETKFPCLISIQADGTTYYFGTLGRDAYTISIPQGERVPTRWMIDAGEEIQRFVHAPDGDESKLQRSLLNILEELIAYYEAHGHR